MDNENEYDLTVLLQRASNGDEQAASRAASAVYDELRALAGAVLHGEKRNQTLRTTALVNEAYIRLVGNREVAWEGRSHFMATAARAMRSILVDYARARNAQKRGGGWKRSPLDDVVDAIDIDQCDLIALDDALSRLESISSRKSHVVELRFFGGLTVAQVANSLNISTGTVENDWEFARSWLRRELSGGES